MNKRTENLPIYRTLSPIWATALPPPMKTKEKVEQGKGTADHLMPLGYLLHISVHLSVCASVCPSVRLFHLECLVLRPGWPVLKPGCCASSLTS